MKKIFNLKHLFVLTSMLLTIALTSSGAADKKPYASIGNSKKDKITNVRVVQAKQTRLVNKLNTTGNIAAENFIIVKSTVEGPISFCPWREGSKVKKSDKLIEIKRPVYAQQVRLAKASLDVAKAKLADLRAGTRPEEIAQAKENVSQKKEAASFAKADLERIMALVKSGALAGEMAEKARVNCVRCKTDLAAAKERLNMLKSGHTRTIVAIQTAVVAETDAKLGVEQAKYDECKIIAPFSGIITKVFVREGDLATPRAPLLKMYEPKSIVVKFAVPEASSARIHLGLEVKVHLDAYSGKSFDAVVSRVYPYLATDSRTRMVEAKVSDAPELLPGMFARVSVELEIENCVAIPDEAIVSTVRGDKIAYVVKNGKSELRKLSIGLEYNNMVQVLTGVKAGEMVVTDGSRSLKDGAKVKVLSNSKAKVNGKTGEPE